jgi:hypothetical protein
MQYEVAYITYILNRDKELFGVNATNLINLKSAPFGSHLNHELSFRNNHYRRISWSENVLIVLF